MEPTIERFMELDLMQKKEIHLYLCDKVLLKLEKFMYDNNGYSYVESVIGTIQRLDASLPRDAYDCAKKGNDSTAILKRYREPIISMKDGDLNFPKNIEYGYYSIFNLFQKYTQSENIDDWLIVNQGLSIEGIDLDFITIFKKVTKAYG